jgi:uncharacterized membrane protein
MSEHFPAISETNVGDAERWVSVIFGSALAVYGLKMRSVPGLAVGAVGAALVWRGATGSCPVYEAFGVSTAPGQGDQVSVPYGKGVGIDKTVTIDATPEKLYAFWRNFENLPKFMHNLESVSVHDANRSHWVARGPAGTKVAWEAEIINEIPNELIGWRSIDGSQVDNAGSVHFTPIAGGRGTEIKVVLRYDPPAGVVGAAISKLLGEDPEAQVGDDLRRLKLLFESTKP